MTVQTIFLTAVVLAFSTLFVVLMYAWITVNLHQMKKTIAPAQATPAKRPEPAPLKMAA